MDAARTDQTTRRLRALRSVTLGVGWLVAMGSGDASADAARALSSPVPDVPHAWAVLADTSGAALEPRAARVPFRADARYAAPGCLPGRIYWRRGGGAPPPCTSTQWIEADAVAAAEGLRCAAARPDLASLGWRAAGRLRQWDPVATQWTSLESGARGSVECEDDRGAHGAAPGRHYAADGGPEPWAGVASAEVSWEERRETYTLYTSAYVAWWHGGALPAAGTWREAQALAVALAAARWPAGAALLRHSWNEHGTNDTAAEGGMTLLGVPSAAVAAGAFGATLRDAEYGGGAPLAETLLEALAVLSGAPVAYGLESRAAPTQPLASTAETRRGPAGALYRSPLAQPCSRAYVTLLSAGPPSLDAGALRRAWPGGAPGQCRAALAGDCVSRLLNRLGAHDAAPLAGTQSLLWDWLVAGNAADWARDLADRPQSSTLDELPLRLATAARASSSAPGIAWPATTRPQVTAVATAGGEAYAVWVEPAAWDRWRGGLRRLRFAEDADDLAAAAPGDEAAPAAPGERRAYTDVAGPALTAAANRIGIDNANLTPGVLGIETGDPQARRRAIDWALGVDTADSDGDGDRAEARADLGAMLGAPGIVRYADGRTVVYAGSGDGLLHAFADGTRELWAYLPQRFLGRLGALHEPARTGHRHAGIDGDLRVLTLDLDADRRIDLSRGERALVLFGLRRGGRAYYAVDVSDPEAPRLAWTLGPRELPGLGQTWAAPVPVRLTIGGVRQNGARQVVLLAGGHDPAQDVPRSRARDRVGAALYLVDAFSGALLWHASSSAAVKTPDLDVPSLDYAIAATPRALDLDGDGELDRAYVADTGGQVFRFEFTRGATPAELARAVRIARLGGTAAADRRFYAEPDVSLVRRGTPRPYLAITLGSGFAPDPLHGGVADRLYSLRDSIPDRHRPPPAVTVVTDDELPDVTPGGVDPTSHGWKRRLTLPGERVLVPVRTIDHRAVVPAWIPPANAVDGSCIQPPGSNRLHVVDVRDGRPRAFRVIEAEEPPDPEPAPLATPAIAPALALVARPPTAACGRACRQQVSGLVGTEFVPVNWPGGVVRAGWAERGIE
jgi:type IV pilus assembly protein PilY1